MRAFIAKHGHLSPKPGGGRQKPSRKALDWQKLLLEHGYFARNIPREYGGFGLPLDVLELAVIAEEISKANVYPGIMNQGISMLVPTLLEVGTKEQCAKWIEPTIRGEIIWCQGYSEPGSGSDLAAAKTKAEVEDGQFVINGQKIWTSSAHYSDMMFLLCRTEPDKPKHQGLSYLLVPMTAPGIEVRPLVTMTGRADLQRDLLHRRARARRPDRDGARRRLACRQRHAQVRAAAARRCQQAVEPAGAHPRADGAHDPGWPAHHGHSRVPRPAAAPAGRGHGLQVSRAAAADRAGAGRGLRRSSA